MDNTTCPDCGSSEFITEPNQYDVLTFEKNDFKIVSVEQIDEFKIFCRDCSIELKKSNIKNGISIVKK